MVACVCYACFCLWTKGVVTMCVGKGCCLSVHLYIEGVVSSRRSHPHLDFADFSLHFLLMPSNSSTKPLSLNNSENGDNDIIHQDSIISNFVKSATPHFVGARRSDYPCNRTEKNRSSYAKATQFDVGRSSYPLDSLPASQTNSPLPPSVPPPNHEIESVWVFFACFLICCHPFSIAPIACWYVLKVWRHVCYGFRSKEQEMWISWGRLTGRILWDLGFFLLLNKPPLFFYSKVHDANGSYFTSFGSETSWHTFCLVLFSIRSLCN